MIGPLFQLYRIWSYMEGGCENQAKINVDNITNVAEYPHTENT